MHYRKSCICRTSRRHIHRIYTQYVRFLSIALSNQAIIPCTVNRSSCIIVHKRGRYRMALSSPLPRVSSTSCRCSSRFYECRRSSAGITLRNEELRSGPTRKPRETAWYRAQNVAIKIFMDRRDSRSRRTASALRIWGRIAPSLVQLAR